DICGFCINQRLMQFKSNVLLPGAEKIDEGANSHRPPRIGAFRASLLAARTARDRFGFFVSLDVPP
ncbi:hypothetical protein, partial [Microcoleus sp. herbarium12]|uniref:hypothetical protein n=1 Tax=Microcoleus sp. herbarium12 TaxID=3055437 RepID=UPI002FD308B7